VVFQKIGFAFGMILFCGMSSFGAEDMPVAQHVEIRTSLGTIVVELDPISAPQNCQAFLSYIHKHVYQDSDFYRADGASVQGGKPGPQAEGFAGSGNFFKDAPPGEFHLKHLRGAIGLARTVGDCNPTKSSNSTQFYIMRTDFPKDDGEYSVFGHVIQGMKIVDQIASSLADGKKSPIKFDVVVQ
jgi:cyclophilin family peptidyl-prolyl cis-trans isomerase